MAEKKKLPHQTFSANSPEAMRVRSGKPNVPCFDFDPQTLEPVLADGEKVISETEPKGFPEVLTTHCRKIFICSLDQYEQAYGPVTDRELFLYFYPHIEGELDPVEPSPLKPEWLEEAAAKIAGALGEWSEEDLVEVQKGAKSKKALMANVANLIKSRESE